MGVILSDTAGRPWRNGQTDFALGASGIQVIDDLRGSTDANGRLLSVTERCIADEIAAAADLVKGKATGVPAAHIRGLGQYVRNSDISDSESTSPARGIWSAPGRRTGSATAWSRPSARPLVCSPAQQQHPRSASPSSARKIATAGDGRALRVALLTCPDAVGRGRRQHHHARGARRLHARRRGNPGRGGTARRRPDHDPPPPTGTDPAQRCGLDGSSGCSASIFSSSNVVGPVPSFSCTSPGRTQRNRCGRWVRAAIRGPCRGRTTPASLSSPCTR